MAVDTENKRRSVICVLPAPDGTIAAVDRQQISWIYSGIAVAEAVAGYYLTVASLMFKKFVDTIINDERHIKKGLGFAKFVKTELTVKE